MFVNVSFNARYRTTPLEKLFCVFFFLKVTFAFVWKHTKLHANLTSWNGDMLMRITGLIFFVSLVFGCQSSIIAEIVGPSEAGYTQVYGLHIDGTNYQNNVPYHIDNSGSVAPFTRIAYHLEIGPGPTPNDVDFVWVSMDAFTNDVSLIGVPSIAGSNAIWQQSLSNMNIFSNHASISTGSGIQTGNIEFWRFNYSPTNGNAVPGASNTSFDFGDTRATTGNYGSMQIHNYGARQTLFALNRFEGTSKDLGIGNQGTGELDWTFAQTANNYQVKTLEVWVNRVPEPTSFAMFSIALVSMFRRRRLR